SSSSAMANLKAYLAEKYMTGPKADAILAKSAPLKKKKRKVGSDAPAPSTSFVIDVDGGWGDQAHEEKDDIEDAVVASDRSFKKRKVASGGEASGWATIVQPAKAEEEDVPLPDEQPQIVDEEETPFRGGLLSAKQLSKALPNSRTNNAVDESAEEIALAQETIYRDSSGKKIDTKAARAEAARLKRLKEEKEAQKMEWGKGLVQRDEAEKRKQELEKQRNSKFARHADDAELNAELKSKEIWNDPAAQFLTVRFQLPARDLALPNIVQKKHAKGPRRPEYTGPTPAPNRFGIKPGYRWDGVDRGNGFEKKLFQHRNEQKRKGNESYQWGTEDM
ncbi:unnamed protein product, partial [Mycena citricolor]